MRGFFRAFMQGLDRLRLVLTNLVFILMLLVFISAFLLARPELPEQAVLLIEPDGKLVEQIERPDPAAFPLALPSAHQTRISDIEDALTLAHDDPRILAVRLDLEQMSHASLATLQRLGRAIEAFKSSGKPVIAYGEGYSQSQYYLAAAADKVFLHPMGLVSMQGFAVYRNYFRSMLDKLKVEVTVFRAGEYKSAAEPLMRDSMSDAARKANRAWMDVLWQAYKSDIERMRGIKPARLQQLLDAPAQFLAGHEGDMAALLKSEHVVDALMDRHQVDAWLADQVHWQGSKRPPELDFKQYVRLSAARLRQPDSPNRIAIITASGPVLDGQQPSGTIGGDTVADLLRKAREDARIKAVVMRIDSPGGSALASEVIRKEVERVRAAGKPVVVSMGGVAASGGYWIASAADEIWAAPTTLTGSLGVFGIYSTLHRGMDALGIHTDGLGTTKVAGAMRADRPLDPEVARIFQLGVDHIYRQFLKHVAEGRKMRVADVDKIAQGRVWSGLDARRIGLVDRLGGLKEAIASAAGRAGVSDDFRTVKLEPKQGFTAMLMEDLFGEAKGSGVVGALLQQAGFGDHVRALLAPLRDYVRLNDPAQVYAYSELPY
jgi:protease-4